jgi:predicted metal-dependent RNase
MSEIQPAPTSVYLIHGEPQAQAVFAEEIERTYGWPVFIPALNDVVKFAV